MTVQGTCPEALEEVQTEVGRGPHGDVHVILALVRAEAVGVGEEEVAVTEGLAVPGVTGGPGPDAPRLDVHDERRGEKLFGANNPKTLSDPNLPRV